MSLAYKLWKIGKALKKEDIKKVIQTNPDTLVKAGDEPEYVNLDFKIDASGDVGLKIRHNSVSKREMFFTKKLGGSGSGIYYLYPNLVLKLTDKQNLTSKLPLLINTMKSSVLEFSERDNNFLAQAVVDFFETRKEDPSLAVLDEIKGGIFWFWISINGHTLPKLMPEIWDNWFTTPVTQLKEASPGYDIFTGKKTTVGYRPEFKIFSYDQYHDSLNYRVRDNLPLSPESAGKIKLAWIYILEKLVFFYKGLEYIILPNLIMDDDKSMRIILTRLAKANAMTKNKKEKLQALRKEEKKISENLEKLRKQIKSKKEPDQEIEKKAQKKEQEYTDNLHAINQEDTGHITEFKNQADVLEDLKHAVTLDFIFTSINRTNLSFEVKGSIEDVVPSRLSLVVNTMRDKKIDENIGLKARVEGKTYLQDFFNRDELYFVTSKSQHHNGNRILQERLHLSRLLLTDTAISLENLMKRFEFNREYDYAHKKRINNGVRDWVNYPSTYRQQEETILSFFQTLNKIKE
jgi:CRISPR-associated protein Csh1